jgi:hypothetical protein
MAIQGAAVSSPPHLFPLPAAVPCDEFCSRKQIIIFLLNVRRETAPRFAKLSGGGVDTAAP